MKIGNYIIKPWANLRNANLRSADLRNADLHNADLHNADLYCATLCNANLRNADLYGANLHNADLYGANLRNADLYGATLRNADLRNTDLRNTEGFYLLPVQDKRGYCFAHAQLTDKGWQIRAGCRDFSVDEALEHWGDNYAGDREQGDMYLHAVNWLISKEGLQ